MDKSPTVNQLVAFRSSDRDKTVWPNPNDYEIELPKYQHCSSIRLASFECPNLPQMTIEEGVNDLLHVHEGCIIGNTRDYSTAALFDAESSNAYMHENELILSYRDTVNNYYKEHVIAVPSYENAARIVFSSSPTVGSNVTATVTTVAPHGLHATYSGPKVLLVTGPCKDVVLADDSGISSNVSIIDRNSFTVTCTALTTKTEAVATINSTEPSYEALAEVLNLASRAEGVNLFFYYARGHFRIRFDAGILCKDVKLHYSANIHDTSENPRGLGLALGFPEKSLRGISSVSGVSAVVHETTGGLTAAHEVVLPGGFVDIGNCGSLLIERMNTLNLTQGLTLDTNGLQLGITDEIGVTSAVRLPSGKYTLLSFKGALEAALANVVSDTWTLDYYPPIKSWRVTRLSGEEFAFHFGSAAEMEFGWYTSTNAPPNSNAAVLLARMLGFIPNSSNYSTSGVLVSTVKSSIANLIKYPRYSNLNATPDTLVSGYLHTEDTSAYRMQRPNYIVGSRDPSTKRLGIGSRKSPVVKVIVTSVVVQTTSSACVSNSDVGNIVHIILQPSGTYTFPPPISGQVGHFMLLGNGSASGSVKCISTQIISISTSGSAVTLRADASAAQELLGYTGASFPLSDACYLSDLNIPKFSILSQDSSSLTGYRSQSLGERLGLTRDLVDVSAYSEMPSMWSMEHESSLLLDIQAVGCLSDQQPTMLSRVKDTYTSATARIILRTSGILHINSMGNQELSLPNQNISRIRIKILNNDGTPYKTHELNHAISLLINYRRI